MGAIITLINRCSLRKLALKFELPFLSYKMFLKELRTMDSLDLLTLDLSAGFISRDSIEDFMTRHGDTLKSLKLFHDNLDHGVEDAVWRPSLSHPHYLSQLDSLSVNYNSRNPALMEAALSRVQPRIQNLELRLMSAPIERISTILQSLGSSHPDSRLVSFTLFCRYFTPDLFRILRHSFLPYPA